MSVQISRLSNGLRIVTETRPNIETAAIGVWVDAGSRHETPQSNGVTHCLEHMLFKGTTTRSARDLALAIEEVGGHMNAYTSREHTTFYARVLKEDVALALELLADILLNSVMDSDELEREKEVILQEIGQAYDMPDDIIFDYVQEVAFPGQALGRSILGTADTVRAMTPNLLKTYLRDRYHAGALVISAVGNLDHDALVKQAENLFGKLPTGNAPVIETAVYKGGVMRENRDLEQTHVALGWLGASFDADDYYALQLYSTLLGGGMSSRLFQEVREERGLAYSVYSFASSHQETGLFSVYAGTGPEQAADLLPVIRQEMAGLRDGLREGELKLGKAQLKAGLLMALEQTTSRMEQIGRQMLIYGRVLETDELISSVADVTAKDVQDVGARILAHETPTLVMLGGDEIEGLSWQN